MSRPGRLLNWQPAMVHRACLREIAAAFGVPESAMYSRGRVREVSEARQGGYWVVRQRFARLTWEQIGKLFGGRDHSTVLHGVRAAERLRLTCADYRARTDALAAAEPVTLPPRSDLRAVAAALHRIEETRGAQARRAAYRRFEAEVRAYELPRPHLLNIQLKGQDGCPRLPEHEIAARRESVAAERRAREIALLEIEAARYGLPRRGLALSEMAA